MKLSLFFLVFLFAQAFSDSDCELCQRIEKEMKEKNFPSPSEICGEPLQNRECIEFLWVYGKTLAKKIEEGKSDICLSLVDYFHPNFLFGNPSFLCSFEEEEGEREREGEGEKVAMAQMKEAEQEKERERETLGNFFEKPPCQKNELTFESEEADLLRKTEELMSLFSLLSKIYGPIEVEIEESFSVSSQDPSWEKTSLSVISFEDGEIVQFFQIFVDIFPVPPEELQEEQEPLPVSSSKLGNFLAFSSEGIRVGRHHISYHALFHLSFFVSFSCCIYSFLSQEEEEEEEREQKEEKKEDKKGEPSFNQFEVDLIDFKTLPYLPPPPPPSPAKKFDEGSPQSFPVFPMV